MSILKKLRVGQRIGAGFGLMALLLLAVSVLGVHSARRASGIVDGEMAAAQQRIALSNALVRMQVARDLDVRQIGLLTDVVSMQRIAATARATGGRFAEELGELIQLTPNDDDRALLSAVNLLDQQAKPLAERAMNLALSVEQEDAARVLTEKLDPLSAAQRDKLDQYSDRQRQIAEQLRATLGEDATRAAWLMAAAAVIGVACAVLGGLLVARSVTVPLRRAVELADDVAAGRLGRRLHSDSQDEIGALVRALDRMSSSLGDVIGTMSQSADSIRHASGEIAAGNQHLSSRTEQQASALQQTRSAIDQMAESVRRTAEAARQATALAADASREAGEGGKRVGEVVSTMEAITQSSRQIADIIGTIDGIAFQTNILALNAAVEAARAGDQGRGFAVVASEVRSLAQRSATAAREIKGLISANVVKVEQGSALVGKAGRTVAGVVDTAASVATLIAEIGSATSEQATGIDEVRRAVSSIDESTLQNAALVEQSAAAAEALTAQAQSLHGTVGRFVLA